MSSVSVREHWEDLSAKIGDEFDLGAVIAKRNDDILGNARSLFERIFRGASAKVRQFSWIMHAYMWACVCIAFACQGKGVDSSKGKAWLALAPRWQLSVFVVCSQGKGFAGSSDKGKGKKRPADTSWSAGKGADWKKPGVKCYNCSGFGHMVADCRRPVQKKY